MEEQEGLKEEQEGLKIDLGCGQKPKPGYIGIDKVASPNVQYQLDLEQTQLPFPDDSVVAVNADQLLEHIHNLIPLMNEIHRVCRNGAIVHITVPNQAFPQAFQDPTHVRYFTPATFDYFCKNTPLSRFGRQYGIKPFKMLSIQLMEWMIIVKLQVEKETVDTEKEAISDYALEPFIPIPNIPVFLRDSMLYVPRINTEISLSEEFASLMEKILTGGYDLIDLAAVASEKRKEIEFVDIYNDIKSRLTSAEFKFMNLLSLTIPEEHDIVIVDYGITGVSVHATKLWEKLNESTKTLLITSSRLPYGYNESLEKHVLTMEKLCKQGLHSNTFSFIYYVRTILKKMKYKLLYFSHRSQTPFYFDIIRERNTIIHCDGYYDTEYNVGRVMDNRYDDEEALTLLMDVLYAFGYSNPRGDLSLAIAGWRALRDAKENWCWTPSQTKGMKAAYPMLVDKIHHVPPMVDTDKYYPTGEQKLPMVLFVTSMSNLKDKGFTALLKAAKTIPEHIKFRFVVQAHEEAAKELKDLGDRTIIGTVPANQMLSVYNQAIVFCRLSTSDSAPLSVLESMACGTPVIVSPTIAANIEIIEDGVTGFVVNPDDIERLVESLKICFSDHDKVKWMGQQCVERVRSYSMKENLDKILNHIS